MTKPADECDSNGLSVVHDAGKSGAATAREQRAPVGTAPLLTAVDVEAIAEATARRLAEMVSAPPTFGLVDARELAEGLGVSLDYVYSHATELGAMRLGMGPKARMRFDRDRARQALEARFRRSNGKRRR
jgi:hypothetical protein